MRPLAVDIQGFTAFRTLQQVDLRNFDLFVITGPTGSGKTSFLDAIIFALYGKVPRAGSHSVRDLVSHGIAESRVRFEFELDGERYQVARRLPRSGAQTATLERAEGGVWRSVVDGGGVREVNNRIEQLLKLPFEAFTRAVVLPQGEFHRFLKGERDARRQILTDLLGLGQYAEIGRRARGRAAELRTRIETTQAILDQQYRDATSARRDELAELAGAAEKRAAALEAAVREAETVEAERGRLDIAAKALADRCDDMSLVDHELSTAKETYAEAQAREEQLASHLIETSEAVDVAQSALAERKRDYEALIARCGTLERLAVIEAAIANAARAAATLTQRRTRQHELEGELRTLEQLATTAEAESEAAQLRLDASEEGAESARKRLAETEEEQRQAADRLDRATTAARQVERLQEALDNASHRLETAAAAEGPANDALESAQRAVVALQREHLVATVARGLEPGDPCPVCSRPLVEHPRVPDAEREQLVRAEARLEEARRAADAVGHELAAAREAQTTAAATVDKVRGDLVALLAGESVEEVRDRAQRLDTAVREQAKVLAAATTEVKRAGEEHATAQREAATKRAEAQGREDLLKQLRRDIESAEADRDAAQEVVSPHFPLGVPAEPAVVVAKERGELERLSAAVRVADEQLTAARDARDEAATSLSAVREELTDSDQAIATLRGRCEALPQQASAVLITIGDGWELQAIEPAAPARDEHVSALRSWCHHGQELLQRAVEATQSAKAACLCDLKRICAGHGVAVDGDLLVAIRGAAASAAEDRGATRQAAQQVAALVEQRIELETGISEERDHAALLDALSAELRNDRFIAFILQETLDLLAARASEELLRISDDRYSLISRGGEFDVVDHVNADETRGVNTLSGGETFLASLALALALSQHVGDLATEGMGAKLQAVFIDEGFGSLDPDTLGDVVDALERLREGNLLVGVISHVPLLSERIAYGLKVEKMAGGSVITGVDVG